MSNLLNWAKETDVSFKHGTGQVTRRLVTWGVVGTLAIVGMLGMTAIEARAEEAKLSAEQIMKTNPDLYRQIQDGPRLPPPEVDPAKPYDPYPGFFAQPVFKPGQIEDWWENSAFEYSPMYPYLLKHTHMKFSYSGVSGNDEGHFLKGGLLLALRKDRFTYVFGYEEDRKSIQSSDGSSTKKKIMNIENTLLYELNPYLFVEGGFHWQKLSVQMIDNRYIPFVGIGSYNVLQGLLDKKVDRLKVNLGFGRVKDEYAPFVSDLTGIESSSFNAVYTKAEFSHKFTDMLTYRQDIVYKQAIDETPKYNDNLNGIGKAVKIGTTKRFDWSWTNSLEFALNQYVGCLFSYNVALDSNPGPTILKRDTTYLVGFKFAY